MSSSVDEGQTVHADHERAHRLRVTASRAVSAPQHGGWPGPALSPERARAESTGQVEVRSAPRRAPEARARTQPAACARLALLLRVGGLVFGLVSGCYSEYPCAAESCDGRDNDCDGEVDETYLDADGRLSDVEHCGGCEVRCAEVFPSAAEVACSVEAGEPACVISACAPGERAAGSGACVPDMPVDCLPCAIDEECALRSEGARCVPDALGATHCAAACDSESACADGYDCTTGLCRPRSGACACDASMQDASFACELWSPDARSCPGTRQCKAAGLTECAPLLPERCNGRDDDCDGKLDESFMDEAGRYVTQQHCGECGAACVAQGPHVDVACQPTNRAARCEERCESGWVDVDGLAANGCECQLQTNRTPVISGDQDCDGEIDPVPELVFVSLTGSDANAGTSPELAVQSLSRGMLLGAQLARPVVVARGIYRERVSLVAGVTLVGGYSPDFTEHDPELYPVWLEAPPGAAGAAVLRCQDIAQPSYVADLTVRASDAIAPGQGSTAVWLVGCTDQVELSRITVVAARGADGQPGADSSAQLAARGGANLAALAGVSGGVGQSSSGQSCAVLPGGQGGDKLCETASVSGGDGGPAQCAALSCSNAGAAPCGNAGCSDFTQGGVCDIEAARAVAVPNPSPEPGRGLQPGAAAEATYDAPTNHDTCSFCDDNPSLPRIGGAGGDGRPGAAGSGGAGCDRSGSVDGDGRLGESPGGDGADGQSGSGGGGGSAGAGYAVIGATRGRCSSVPGAAGGGGGSGGCGAPGAAGGGGAGSSIGIVIRLSPGSAFGPRLSELRVVTASGGDAGDGGVGAAGGAGGSGGVGGVSTFWCARNGGRGGDGGAGGDAGGGGGGCGGSTFGVYLLHDAADEQPAAYAEQLAQGVRVEIAGSSGRAGRGGFSPTHPGLAGRPGVVAELQVAALP